MGSLCEIGPEAGHLWPWAALSLALGGPRVPRYLSLCVVLLLPFPLSASWYHEASYWRAYWLGILSEHFGSQQDLWVNDRIQWVKFKTSELF